MHFARCLFTLTLACISVAQTAPPSDLYYVVFLRPDPARKPISQQDGERIMASHMANINALAESGAMVAAGPFDAAEPRISGIFVFKPGPKASTLQQALHLATQDPTVVEHRNTVDAYVWHGPGNLGSEYRRLHQANPDTPADMGLHPFWMLYRGPKWDERSPLLTAHGEYMQKLRRDGKLSTTGPVDANDAGLQSIAVFHRIPEAESRALMQDDPAVKAGLLRAEYHGWMCAAHVLPEIHQL